MSWRHEPLVAFLILAAGFFALDRLKGGAAGERGREIVVSAAQVEQLKSGFAETWSRQPSSVELEGLIEDSVRTEVLAREAVAMGLDRDDTIVRRRLRSRLEALADDLGNTEPSEEDLAAYLASHPDSFRVEPRFTFKQIYFNPNHRGATLEHDVTSLLAKLEDTGPTVDLDAVGDGSLLDVEFTDASRREVATTFGEGFAKRLSELELGKWHGPIPSGYGVHLVLLQSRQAARLPPLAEVRAAVHREWTAQHIETGRELFYAALRKQYVVTLSPDIGGERP